MEASERTRREEPVVAATEMAWSAANAVAASISAVQTERTKILAAFPAKYVIGVGSFLL